MIQVDYNTACSKAKGDDSLIKHLSFEENIKIDLPNKVRFLGMVFFADALEINDEFLDLRKRGEVIAYKLLKSDIIIDSNDKEFIIKEST
ncbi:hypothetical protein [Clostridium kluyveri]|uniref:Uncharacterized protein n=1 Tax=Clostridium kluyveri TaxID=1534 RepID=A0A1L5F8V2_CLOKL|nr:hypothetical protein [Clostridium kluyveri]APM39444.1 hypothetical protein BS101_12160 [Clostridium kluyveri]